MFPFLLLADGNDLPLFRNKSRSKNKRQKHKAARRRTSYFRDYVRDVIARQGVFNSTWYQYDTRFRSWMGRDTFFILYHGGDVSIETVVAFADALALKPIDRTELLLAWAEDQIRADVFTTPVKLKNRFVKDWLDYFESVQPSDKFDPHRVASLDELIEGYNQIVGSSQGQAAPALQNYLNDSRSGTIADWAKTAGMSLKYLRETFKRRRLVNAQSFRNLTGLRPGSSALAKVRALYICELLGSRLPRLTPADLEKGNGYRPKHHVRATAWLLSLCFEMKMKRKQARLDASTCDSETGPESVPSVKQEQP